jgi:uncharacterized protein (TIGR02996 family)
MTSSHDALYRAICAHPDEDTPRLAFADLIEERGDDLRARFIRTQVALARVPEYDAEWVKARQFEPDAATGWSRTEDLPKPLPAGASWQRFEFRRGFPWKVGVRSLREFLGGGGAVFDAAPVQALDIDAGDRPDRGALADWPHLARLRKLEFSSGWFGADDLARLGDSESAANVTELGFEFDGITPEGLAALAASELFPRLTGLELRSNNIPGALVADSLAEARGPGALSRLGLPYNRFGRDDAEQLVALPLMRQLQHLDLSDNRLGVPGVTALAESGVARGLRILNLCNTKPGVPGVKALVESGGLGGLRMLDLSHNALGPVAVKALANCGSLRGLRVLSLANNLVGDAGAAALAGSRALGGLLELDLRDADVGESGARALAESPHLENLLRLDLRTRDGRPLSADATRALVRQFGDRVRL